ncbi:uncharacterized protein [Onthophagus taurus]|uniref:uncharacterized protein n=1 Tax=Onthophagus taurus TaxID=166361 RepID=UPI0039BE8529
MKSSVQKYGESASAYFHDKFKLCRDLNLTVSETVEEILKGLMSNEIAGNLCVKSFADTEELYRDILTAERISAARKDTRPRGTVIKDVKQVHGEPDSKKEESSWKSEEPRRQQRSDRCYRCGERGHMANKCTQPRIVCFGCKGSGHLKKDCPNSTGETTQKRIMMVEDTVTNLTKYLKRVLLNEEELLGLIDPGSAVCTIQRSMIGEKLQREQCDLKLTGFGGGSSVICNEKVRGRVVLDSVFANAVEFYVVPDEAQKVPLIIGRPFTERPEIAYARVKDELVFGWQDAKPFKDFEFTPPNKVTVTVKDDNVVLRPNSINLIVAEEPNGESILLPVYNETSKEVNIKRGAVMGEIREGKKTAEIDTVNEQCNNQITEEDINYDGAGDAKHSVLELCTKYRNCFAFSLKELGCTNKIKMDIRDTNIPVRRKPYRVTIGERESRVRKKPEWMKDFVTGDFDQEVEYCQNSRM